MRMTGLLLLATTVMTGCAPLAEMIDRAGRSGGVERGDRVERPGEVEPPPRGPRASATFTPPPLFGDWWTNMPPTMRATRKPTEGDPCAVVPRLEYRTPNTYVPVNVPGAAHGGPSYAAGSWYSWYARCVAQDLDRVGAPIAILLRERNCPFPYATNGQPTSPGELSIALDVLPKLDYLILDFEPIGGGTPEDVKKNAAEVVRLVRSHPNPRVSRAFIGNYEDWPGRRDEAAIWPDKRDRTRATVWRWDRDAFYHKHFNIAMPSAYPYAAHSRHSDAAIQKGPVTPSDRAAIFWAPLESASAAARDLPPGHLLIPWVSNYVAFDEPSEVYDAPPPPRDDLSALIRHLRLRGAHSYMIWTSDADKTDHPDVNLAEYRELAMDAWTTLDPLFEGHDGPPRVLNLETDKASGVQWSGMIVGEKAWVLVSNLGPDDDARVRLPALDGLPDQTPPVPRDAHRLFRWRLD